MRDRPHPNHKLEWPGGVVPEWARPQQGAKRFGKGRGNKGGHERQGGSSPSKRERLQKVMAQSGHGSRRNIEILIAQGHITINGQVAKLGDSVGPGDKVKLDGNLITLRYGQQLPRVLMYHKPEGEIVSRDDPEKRPTVFDKLPKVNGGRWVSVGRLDLNTGGLLLFTTDGELANKLTHPRFEVEREYAVRVLGELTGEQRDKLLKTGVDIEGDNCTFDSIEDRGGEGSNHWYHVVLREGKNREVRKMMEAVGLMVSRLMRVRFGNVTLPGHVKRGMLREMEEEQVQELLNFAGMNEPPEEAERSEAEDDALENFGNRIDHHREPRVREIDDDIGNKVRAAPAPAPEPDGNRGTYNPNAAEDRPPKHAPRRPHGAGHKPFFNKKRGQGGAHGGDADSRGNRAPPEAGHHRDDSRGNTMGGNAQGQGHGQGRGHGHGQNAKHKRRKHGAQQPNQGAAPKPAAAGGQPGQPGQGKPGRNRRNKNRNRNRGGGGAQEARVESPPTNGGNQES
jgi:23S rRNA pseudouridine2605 synthase